MTRGTRHRRGSVPPPAVSAEAEAAAAMVDQGLTEGLRPLATENVWHLDTGARSFPG